MIEVAYWKRLQIGQKFASASFAPAATAIFESTAVIDPRDAFLDQRVADGAARGRRDHGERADESAA
jgi:hypothetical protein